MDNMIVRVYYKLLKDVTASKILASLVSSPQRYEYIAKKVESGELTNDQATQKNVNKSILMADQLIKSLK